MKRIGFVGLGLSGVVLVVSVILLLNFTAQNPTGRRYSSVAVTTAGNSGAIGLAGERILSVDLGVPRNDDPDQRQCLCNSSYRNSMPSVAECRVCYAYSQSIANTRRPDFVTPNYIAESKNRRDMPYGDRDLVNQIGDYAVAARAQNVPLWLYVRTDTDVDPEFYRMVQETGGDIIPYFAGESYTDRIDQMALYGAGGSAVGLLFFAGWVMLAGRGWLRWGGNGGGEPRPKKPSSPKPTDPLSQAMQSMDNFESFTNQSKDSSRRSIDESDSREDI